MIDQSQNVLSGYLFFFKCCFLCVGSSLVTIFWMPGSCALFITMKGITFLAVTTRMLRLKVKLCCFCLFLWKNALVFLKCASFFFFFAGFEDQVSVNFPMMYILICDFRFIRNRNFMTAIFWICWKDLQSKNFGEIWSLPFLFQCDGFAI